MGWFIFIIVLIVLWNVILYIGDDKNFSIGDFFAGVLCAAATWFVLLFISVIVTSCCPRTFKTIVYEPLSLGSTYIIDNHCCINKEDKLKIIEAEEIDVTLEVDKPIVKEHYITAPKWVTAIYPSAFFEYTEYELVIPLTAD